MKNSEARRELQRIYGDGCFMERAGIRTIKGYRKNSHSLTYHHLRHRSEGGATDIDNGANLSLENHEILHTLPRDEEELVNNMIRKWKMNYVAMQGTEVIEGASLEFPDWTKEEECIIIKLEENTEEQLRKLRSKKEKEKRKFNRAKMKQEMQQFIEEELEDEDLEL